MQGFVRGVLRGGAAGALCVVAAGCATSVRIGDAGGASDERPREIRVALAEAAGDIDRTVWPKPESISMGDRLAGVIGAGESKVTRDDAIRFYIAHLTEVGDVRDQLTADAARQIEAARALVAAADALAEDVTPRMSDVALLENAIADLREARSIYLEALREADRPRSPEREIAEASLRAAFDGALRDLGSAADRLADMAMSNGARAFAAPSHLMRRGSL